MDLQAVRELKAHLSASAVEAAAQAAAVPEHQAPGPLALGVAVLGGGRYGLAVRYRLGTPGTRGLVRRVVSEAEREGGGAAVDVRRTGRLHPLVAPATRQRAVVGERGRVRPLRPGASLAHVAVTAGTLGAFVERDGEARPLALSNSHVVADSGRASAGDAVLQPGPADGGRDPDDRVGVLALDVPLRAEEVNAVDAALVRLDEGVEVDPTYPAGRLAGTAVAEGEEEVEKVGRTTGVTQGVVTAIEVDDVVVDYGPGVGALRFDGQVEVSGSGASPFSRGGDSGSLVYERTGRRALGLLFAGSESGGQNGRGLTYCNPVDDVLAALGARLVL